VLLLVDNAHGAYLEFLPESMHPIKLGADICCDSAHKTLPVLTGGAYLHTKIFSDKAKTALSLFGSTSPSYLILQSLDAANKYISDGYKEKLAEFLKSVDALKKTLVENGYTLCGNEPLKITIKAKEYGYYGYEIAAFLEEKNIFCEFSDKDFIVFMLTPEIGNDVKKLENVLISIQKKEKICESAPEFALPEKVLNIKDAVFCESETISAKKCEGRILATANVACPPAVPIVVCGERISKNAIECFEYYGINNITVIK
jgi:arginine/lysine/ornithine decarboxylase